MIWRHLFLAVTDTEWGAGSRETKITGQVTIPDRFQPADDSVSRGEDPVSSGWSGGHQEWDEGCTGRVWWLQGKIGEDLTSCSCLQE